MNGPAASSLEGQLLVASPYLGDMNFAKTVILLIEHGPAGAMGLVVNRPVGSKPMRELLPALGIPSKSARLIDVRFGGPVGLQNGVIVHSPDYRGPKTKSLLGRLAASGGPDVLKAASQGKGPKELAFFIGHAGWAPGQLENEIARQDWKTAPAEAALIFRAKPEDLWEVVRRRVRIDL